MKPSLFFRTQRFLGSVFFYAFSLHAAASGAVTSLSVTDNGNTLSTDSVYQLQATLVDQDGQTLNLPSLCGHPVIVSMFYNSCQFVCPMLIDTVRLTQASLAPDERVRVSILLVTFDPARDDVATLKSIAEVHKLDRQHWTLARTDPATVRKLAAILAGIQYKLLANGDFNHSTALVLLDEQGRIVGRTAKLGDVDEEFRHLIEKTARGK